MARPPEDDEAQWWRSPWETDDEAAVEPPAPPALRRPAAEPDFTHPLLLPLARAQDAVARLEARAGAASPAVAEGLRARMAWREAAGWLSHAHIWIHPQDLALRDAGLTGSYAAAVRAGCLEGELPATAAQGSGFDAPPSDLAVGQALRLGRLWRRLAECRTWTPLADAAAMRETLQSLGCRGAVANAEIEDWLALVHVREQGPALIRAGHMARDWMNRLPATEPLTADGTFLAACLWREKGSGRGISLPFWSAPEQRLHRLALRVGIEWMAGFLDCVAEAASVAAGELDRLQRAEAKGRLLVRTARARLPDALDAVLRAPIVAARGLAKGLDVTPQAALGLLRQLHEAEIVREATGRASWRAFVVA
jgi:DNA binding protein with HTH domain